MLKDENKPTTWKGHARPATASRDGQTKPQEGNPMNSKTVEDADPNVTTKLAKADIEAQVAASLAATAITAAPPGLQQPEGDDDPRNTPTVGADGNVRAPEGLSLGTDNFSSPNDKTPLPAPLIPPVTFETPTQSKTLESRQDNDETKKLSHEAVLEAEVQGLTSKVRRLEEERKKLLLTQSMEIDELNKKLDDSKKREGAMSALLRQDIEDDLNEEFGDDIQKKLFVTDQLEKLIADQLSGGATMQIETRRKKKQQKNAYSLPAPQKAVWPRALLLAVLLNITTLLSYHYAQNIRAFLGIE